MNEFRRMETTKCISLRIVCVCRSSGTRVCEQISRIYIGYISLHLHVFGKIQSAGLSLCLWLRANHFQQNNIPRNKYLLLSKISSFFSHSVSIILQFYYLFTYRDRATHAIDFIPSNVRHFERHSTTLRWSVGCKLQSILLLLFYTSIDSHLYLTTCRMPIQRHADTRTTKQKI